MESSLENEILASNSHYKLFKLKLESHLKMVTPNR